MPVLRVIVLVLVANVISAPAAAAPCILGDADGSRSVSLAEVQQCFGNFLGAHHLAPACTPPPVIPGCGNGVIEAGEDCDVGGTCGGGSKSGMACTSDAHCGVGEKGVCDGGSEYLRQCASDADCGGGKCKRCRTFGGQAIAGSVATCSADCTFETRIPIVLRTGVFDPNAWPPVLTAGTGMILHSGYLGPVPLPLGGALALRVGRTGANGVARTSLKATDLTIPPIDIVGLACACVRSVPAKTCGGFVLDDQGALATDCTPGFPGTQSCPASLPCTFVHGPENAGQGLLGCQGLSPIDVAISQDSNGSADPGQCLEPGVAAPVCADSPLIVLSGTSATNGSQLLATHMAVGIRTGSCSGFCSDADPLSQRGSVNPFDLTTGVSSGLITGHDGIDGENLGPYPATGAPVSCSNLTSGGNSGLTLAGHSTVINENLFGDTVIEGRFEAQ